MPKISALPGATLPLGGTELVPIVQTGVTVQTTVTDILAGAGSGGYPHWVTPSSGFLKWESLANPAQVFFKLEDAGTVTGGCADSYTFSWNQSAGSDFVQETWGASSLNRTAFNNAIIKLEASGAGSLLISAQFNKIVEAGFTSTSRQYITGTPASWGGPGNPPDVETALDRLAVAVAGLLGVPIP
jgi:hypothetical protein